MEIQTFRDQLKKTNGQTYRWFFDKYIVSNSTLTYSGFMSQINGYSPVSEIVGNQIAIYLGHYNNEGK